MMNPMMVRLTVVSSLRSLVCLEPRARIGNACFRQPNAAAQPRLKAGAERTLEGVGCRRLFGWGCPTPRRQTSWSAPGCPFCNPIERSCAFLLNHLIRLEEERRGNSQAKFLRGLEVNDE